MEWAARLKRDERGFTLVELMVALTVLATGIVAVVGVMNTSLNMVSTTSSRTRAVALATRELEELRAIPYDELTETSTLTTTETESFGGKTFTITRTVEWTDRGADIEAYKKGIVTVTWEDRARTFSINQSTFLYPGGQGVYDGPKLETGFAYGDTDPAPTPTSLAAAAGSDPSSEIDLSWTPGADNGVPVETWVIEYTTNGGASWNRITDSHPAASTTYRVEGLANSTTYTFRVASKSPEGVRSAWSNLAALTTSATASVTCEVRLPSITPTAARRLNGSSTSGIDQDPYVSLNTNGLCADAGLYVSYVPTAGVTRTVALVGASGATWVAQLEGDGDTWEMGVKQIKILDTSNNLHGTIAFQVCAHNARSCP